MEKERNPIAIEVHDLTVTYRKKPALWSIDVDIPAGKLTAIVGPNGAGKSTLIKACMELVSLSSGYVKIFDKNINEIRKKVSYVPQRESVDWDFPASVMDIVMMGRYPFRGLFQRLNSEDKRIAADSLEQVGMSAFKDRQIAQLSGGQQQRVFLARALAQQAEVYLMDEPFAGVDAATERSVLELLAELKRQGKTIVVVHHDLQTVQEHFDWAVLLNTRLVAAGEVMDVLNPEILQKAYGGQLNVLSSVGQLMSQGQFPVREN